MKECYHYIMPSNQLVRDFQEYCNNKKSINRGNRTINILYYRDSIVDYNHSIYFGNIKSFQNKMDEYGIYVSPSIEREIENNLLSYCVCKPGTQELIIGHSYKEIKEKCVKT